MIKALLTGFFCLKVLLGFCQDPVVLAGHTVYLFPGMGLDERLFQHLTLPYQVKYITWIPIEKKEDLAHYALRLAQQMDTTRSYSLVGVSMVGMCVSEIAKVYRPRHAILISSAASSKEIPVLMKALRILPLHKLVKNEGYVTLGYATRWLFGIRKQEDARLFKSMLQTMPPNYYPRAVDSIVKWKSKTPGPHLLHLHGDADFILPFDRIENVYRIEKGTHLMVLTQPEKINQLLLDLLAR
ncbi:hypothetical protein TH63_09075 [Rufibacter radiotolerans]|uniref:Alpha/beta hydrolase n=1 Tax=Rufibacter radiotolerans TaxID=1379910 RepID=A0A0H4W5S3_9BACT|nr:alpha/beta hydrolase [Rufibacter radiotolerans]AKQ45766.1 hypothetical protein TH63_09075 [Rufibacter radiotolerans]